ncbi:MAG: cytochrome C [Phenylobacterium sp. SCN 69-14]|nr:MAG: cytochrome C [Phenylobacterium sp. SCN 69-14]
MPRPVARSIALAACAAAVLASPALAQAPSGETLFKQQCGVCHSIAQAPGKMGPPLKGVVGRKAGTLPGYAYSPAMKGYGVTWDAGKLETYLAKPTAAVPGTKMMIGAANPAQRSAIIAYLATQK